MASAIDIAAVYPAEDAFSRAKAAAQLAEFFLIHKLPRFPAAGPAWNFCLSNIYSTRRTLKKQPLFLKKRKPTYALKCGSCKVLVKKRAFS